MSKQYIKKELESVYFDNDIDKIIEELQVLKERYSDYETLRIEEESAYDGGYYHHLYGCRLETDKEYQDRLAYEKRRKDELKQYRLKQFEELKKEFENQ